MSFIVKARRKGTSTVYAYKSESYWVPGVGARSKRTLLGKVDPQTGNIIPTRKRRAKSQNPAILPQDLPDDADQTLQETRVALIRETERNRALEITVQELEEKVRSLESKLSSISHCLELSVSVMQRQMDKCISVVRDS